MIRLFPFPVRTWQKAAISGLRGQFGGRLPRAQEQAAKRLLELMIAIVATIVLFPLLAMQYRDRARLTRAGNPSSRKVGLEARRPLN